MWNNNGYRKIIPLQINIVNDKIDAELYGDLNNVKDMVINVDTDKKYNIKYTRPISNNHTECRITLKL